MSLPSASAPRHAQQASGATQTNKRELRRVLLQKRLGINEKTRLEWDAAIGRHVLQCLLDHSVASLGVYQPMRNEPDLQTLYNALASQSVRLALPLVVDKNAPLEFAAWKPGDPLVKEAFGTMVPAKQEKMPVPEALLAPCVGFNAACFRLGYGGGFFDRTLARQPRPFSIGIAYSCLNAEFETGEYDIPLDCIVTENGILMAK